jgi:hypothetical protein
VKTDQPSRCKAHYAQPVTTIARCWKCTRVDGRRVRVHQRRHRSRGRRRDLPGGNRLRGQRDGAGASTCPCPTSSSPASWTAPRSRGGHRRRPVGRRRGRDLRGELRRPHAGHVCCCARGAGQDLRRRDRSFNAEGRGLAQRCSNRSAGVCGRVRREPGRRRCTLDLARTPSPAHREPPERRGGSSATRAARKPPTGSAAA